MGMTMKSLRKTFSYSKSQEASGTSESQIIVQLYLDINDAKEIYK